MGLYCGSSGCAGRELVLAWLYCWVNIPCAELHIFLVERLFRVGGSVRLTLLQCKYTVC